MSTANPKSILIVEDDNEISATLETFFESEGYTVWTAENGLVALEVLKEHGPPNLILLDMKMPVMNGWQFAAKFVEQFDHQSPIIVMTAAADASARAREISANGWVGKPFNLDHLLTTIHSLER